MKTPTKQIRFCCLPWRYTLIVLTALLVQCAYFNTYYNAEVTFKAANKAQMKVQRNFPDSIVVDPSADIKGKYDKVIEKTNKVLEVYPKDKKWHDDAVFLMAKAYFYKKEMLKAIRTLKGFQEKYPSSEFIPESYVYLGKAYIEEGELTKAEDILQSAVQKYPLLDKGEEITALLVEIAIRREGKSQAITLLEKMMIQIKTDEKKLDLLLRVSELYIEMKQYDKAIATLKKAPRKKDLPYQLFRVDKALLTCYHEQKSNDKALALVNTMIRNSLYRQYMQDLQLQKGLILEKMGRIDEAMAIFKQLTENSDSTKIDSTHVTGRAWLELGYLYQKNKENYKKAQESFTKAFKSRDTTVTVQANRFLLAMAHLDTLRARIARGDSVGRRSERRFTIGEIFRLDLDEPDSAYFEYLNLCHDSAVDTNFVPKALFAAATVSRENLNDTVHSDSLYKCIIDRYSISEYALRAQECMNLPVTVKTRKQSAEEMFRNAEKQYLEGADIKSAIQSFYAIYKQYPDLEFAPKSLYVAAWLSDEELQKHNTAKELYEKICEKYPQSIYCTREAKPRIKVVMDTLEAIKELRKKTEASAAIDAKNRKKITAKDPVQPVVSPKTADQKESDALMGNETETPATLSVSDSAKIAKPQEIKPADSTSISGSTK